ncbi:MAG: Gfo/Idh/MocA family oxidoreductase, partial [Tepidiformaceae bacterium]
MATLRIGLIGAGANTRSMHIPGFRKLPDIEITAVANRSRESGTAVAKEFAIAKVYDSVEELLADRDIDAVCIGTWPYKHREYTIKALEAGKHVLCEARMATTLGEAEEMLAAHERHPELVAQLVPAPFDFRFGPTITRLINEGALGDIQQITVTALNGSSLNPATPIHWRQRREYSGRNVGMLGIYAEVIQRWMGDTTRVVSDGVVTTATRPDAQTGEPTKVDVPDSFGVLARMANGATASYLISGVAAGAPANGIVVFGSKATIRWSPGESATMAEHGKPFEALTSDPGTVLGWRVEEDFVASIREGAPVRLTSFGDGVRYMRFVDAAWR